MTRNRALLLISFILSYIIIQTSCAVTLAGYDESILHKLPYSISHDYWFVIPATIVLTPIIYIIGKIIIGEKAVPMD